MRLEAGLMRLLKYVSDIAHAFRGKKTSNYAEGYAERVLNKYKQVFDRLAEM